MGHSRWHLQNLDRWVSEYQTLWMTVHPCLSVTDADSAIVMWGTPFLWLPSSTVNGSVHFWDWTNFFADYRKPQSKYMRVTPVSALYSWRSESFSGFCCQTFMQVCAVPPKSRCCNMHWNFQLPSMCKSSCFFTEKGLGCCFPCRWRMRTRRTTC